MRILFCFIALFLNSPPLSAQSAPDTVIVLSGPLQLRATVWRPVTPQPAPAVLFAHGSGCGEGDPGSAIAPIFAARGFVFLSLSRRGHGLSRTHGECAGELMSQERATNGDEARARLQFRLMTTDHFDDLQAGIGFLKGLSGVDPARIVVAGHSFGGQLALLAAEADSTLNAVLDFAGAANSWAGSAELRSRLLHAVASTIVPIFIAHAANDFSTEPGTALAAEMAQRGRVHELVIYPPVGESTSDGHDLIFLAPELWAPDVFGFLEKYSS